MSCKLEYKGKSYISKSELADVIMKEAVSNNNTNNETSDYIELKTILNNIPGNQVFTKKNNEDLLPINNSKQELIENSNPKSKSERKSYSGKITTLKPNQVYVFGANPWGLHGAGGAGSAMDKSRTLNNIKQVKDGTKEKWAIKGQTGPMTGTKGESYGLVTVPGNKNDSISIKRRNKYDRLNWNELVNNIKEFYKEVKNNPNKEYFIAYNHLDKASLNGYTGYELMEAFNEAGDIPRNIAFSKEWADTGLLKQGNPKQEVFDESVPEKAVNDTKLILDELNEGSNPVDTINKLGEKGYLYKNNNSFITNNSGRDILIFKINDTPVIFYKSHSGTQGKEQGRWYPVITLTDDWIVKGVSSNYKTGYGNSVITNILNSLNQNYKNKNKNYSKVKTNTLELRKLQGLDESYSEHKGASILNPFVYEDIHRVFSNLKKSIGDIVLEDTERYINGVIDEWTKANKDNPSIEPLVSFFKSLLEIFVDEFKPSKSNNPKQETSNKTITIPNKTINVYWGGQNVKKAEDSPERILSNLAKRPFTYDGIKYGSVEHAYQTLKSGTFDKITYDKYNKIGGYGRKIAPKVPVSKLIAANSLQLMEDLVVESFKQNPTSKATKTLLSYSNFTHNTNQLIDEAFLKGLKLAQQKLVNKLSTEEEKQEQNTSLQKDKDREVAQANIEAGTALVGAANMKSGAENELHKYADRYIAWNRNSPIVQEAITKWGSEEALVQAIGEQAKTQKGKAWRWWTRFIKWLTSNVEELTAMDKESLKNILTDAFLENRNLGELDNNKNLFKDSIESENKELNEPFADIMVHPEISYNMQLQVVKMMVNDIYGEMVRRQQSNDESDITAEQMGFILDSWKDKLSKIVQKSIEKKVLKRANHVQLYVDNFETLKKAVLKRLLQMSSVQTFEDAQDVMEDEAVLEKKNFKDGSTTYLLNPKDTVSVRLKLFMSGIRAGRSNYLGLHATEDYSTVYNGTLELLADRDPDFNGYIDALSDATFQKTNKWAKDLVKKLKLADSQTQNEFVVAMTKHYIKMNMVMLSHRNGKYTFAISNSNANTATDFVMRDWRNAVMNSSITKQTEEGEIVVDEDKFRELQRDFKSFKLNDNDPTLEDIINISQRMGLNLTSDFITDIMKNGLWLGKKKLITRNFFASRSSPFVIMMDRYNSLNHTKESINDYNSPLRDTRIKALAKAQSKFIDNPFETSHMAGDKSVFSYTNNHYAKNRERQLKKLNNSTFAGSKVKTNTLLTSLLKSSFNGNYNQLVEMLKTDKDGKPLHADNGEVIVKEDSKFYETFKIEYLSLEAMKKITGIRKATGKLSKTSPLDHEIIKLAMFANMGNDNSRMFYPTMSDKSTMLTVETMKTPFYYTFKEGFHKGTVRAWYNHLIFPEIKRVQKFNKLSKEEQNKIKGYNKGADKFLITPELHNIPELFNNGELRDLHDDDYYEILKNFTEERMLQVMKDQIKEWKKLGMVDKKTGELLHVDKRYATTFGTKDKDLLTHEIAADYAFNYMFHNMNIFQNFTGDPAAYYKSKSEDPIQRSKDTFTNMGKRLASEIAPGYELAKKGSFRIAYLSDRESKSIGLEFYESLDLKALSEYSKIEGADAQEYTTWREHLDILLDSGKINNKEYNEMSKILRQGEKLSDVQLKKVLQPLKPVYVNTIYDEALDLHRRVYIKSSSFPLLPQLTKGLQIDKLRVAMETPNTGVDRVVHYTAIKVGAPTKGVEIYNEDGTISDNIEFHNAESLPRDSWRIQQDLPYSESKDKVNTGTQERKLLFGNIRNLTGFQYHGDTYKGGALEKKFNETYEKLYKLKHKELSERLEYQDGKINMETLGEMLQDEAERKNYNLNDVLSLEIVDGKFKAPVWTLNSQAKVESLLMSMVNNSIVSSKHKGKSYVLGSEEGFSGVKTVVQSLKDLKKNSNDIIYTSSWADKLLPHQFDETTLRKSQVLVPSLIKDNKGRLVNMYDYATRGADGRLMLDEESIPKNILELFGFRIPTQGHNSMLAMEIVGFLPPAMGDLLIASRDLTKQMGSDFDVDKLYTYQRNTLVREDGTIVDINTLSDDEIKALYREEYDRTRREELSSKIVSTLFGETIESDDYLSFKNKIKQAQLENDILDIHLAILTNPDKEMQRMIAEPLGFGDLKGDSGLELAKNVNTLKENRIGERIFNPLSSTYQRKKFENASAGKMGVAVFSLDSTFNTIAQEKGLRLVKLNSDNNNVYKVVFGNQVSNGTLSNTKTLNGKKYISDVIAAFQSASVDNENEQILDKLNINNETFKVIKTLSLLGFDEKTIVSFINQDIIYEYASRLVSSDSVVSDAKRDEGKIYSELINKYATVTKLADGKTIKGTKVESSLADVSPSELMTFVEKGKTAPLYYETQRAVLKKFMELNKNGISISALQQVVNTDSKGLSKSIYENANKTLSLQSLPMNMNIERASTLIGEYVHEANAMENIEELGFTKVGDWFIKPTTISGYASVYGASFANDLFKDILPYNSKSFNSIISRFEKMKGEKLTEKEVGNLFNGFKSYLYSKNFKDVFGRDINEARYDLLVDDRREKKESLATLLDKIKDNSYLKNNPFFARLRTAIEYGGEASTIVYEASKAEDVDENSIHAAFISLFTNGREIKGHGITFRELANKLVEYSYVNGAIQSSKEFYKYIPVQRLHQLGLIKHLDKLNFNNEQDTNVGDRMFDGFIRQYIQHNPHLAVNVTLTKKNVVTDSKGILTGSKVVSEDDSIDPFIKGEWNNVDFLFQYSLDTDSYVKIPILKNKARVAQYDFNSDLAMSINPKSNFNTTNPSGINTGNKIETTEDTVKPTVKFTDGKKEIIQERNGTESLKLLLNDIDDKYYGKLAKYLSTLIPDNVEFRFVKTDIFNGSTSGIKGKFRIQINEDIEQEDYSRTLLHEVVHLLTKEAILDKSSEAYKRLDVYYRMFKKKMELKHKGKIPSVFLENDTMERAAKNMEEFVAIAMTDMDFQKFMKEEIWSSTNSLWSKFIETLMKVLSEMGVSKGDNLNQKILADIVELFEENKTIVDDFIVATKPGQVNKINKSKKPYAKVKVSKKANPFGTVVDPNTVNDDITSSTKKKNPFGKVVDIDNINDEIELAMLKDKDDYMDENHIDMLPLLDKKCK